MEKITAGLKNNNMWWIPLTTPAWEAIVKCADSPLLSLLL
jgi:hypothetical protein